MKALSVSVIGLGQMGCALARAYVDHGAEVTVWNRSAAKAASVVAQGASLAASLKEAVSANDLIIVCLAGYAISDALLRNEEILPLLKGKTILQLTTGTANNALQAAAWANAAGITYLDGAIMDYPKAVGTNECMLLAAGPKSAYERYANDFKVLGGRFTYVGENVGTANVLDGGLLTLYYASAFGFMQSAAMLMAADVAPETLKHALDAFRPVIDKTCQFCTDQISRKDYAGTEASIHVHLLGVQSLIERAISEKVEHGLLDVFAHYLERARANGYELCELPAAFEAFRPT